MSTFSGHTVRRETGEWFGFVETRHRPGDVVPWHRHDRAYLTFVLRGAYEERTRVRTAAIAAGSAVFHQAGVAHTDHFGSEHAHLLNVEVLESESSDHLQQVLDASREVRGRAVSHTAAKLLYELERHDEWSALIIDAAIVEFLASIWRDRGGIRGAPPRWLERVDELIESRFDEPLTLQEIAREAGVHPAHLARTYRRVRRMTIGDGIRARRIERAKSAILAGIPLSGVALSCGFADQSHFTRWFVRLTGTTPSRFRREWQRAPAAVEE